MKSRVNWDGQNSRSTSRMSATPVPAQPQRCFSRQFNKARILHEFRRVFAHWMRRKEFPIKSRSSSRYKNASFQLKVISSFPSLNAMGLSQWRTVQGYVSPQSRTFYQFWMLVIANKPHPVIESAHIYSMLTSQDHTHTHTRTHAY